MVLEELDVLEKAADETVVPSSLFFNESISKMKKISLFLAFGLLCQLAFAQHDHHVDDSKNNHNHLAHIQASRAQNFYIHNLPPPKLMTGIGGSKMKITTKSEKTQAYFNQGLNLLHDFWDFEAYRAFKEAIRND